MRRKWPSRAFAAARCPTRRWNSRRKAIPAALVVESCKTALRERVVCLTRALPADDPDVLADGLILLIEGAFSAHHVFGSQGPANAFTRSAERLISSHLKN